MKEKPTSFDIAQLAGVSQPTVSRALRGSKAVSEATRQRIEEIAKRLNYKVDKNASSLRSHQSHTLALLIFEDAKTDDAFINPFFLAMLGSIVRTCALSRYDLMISFQEEKADWHLDYRDTDKADGLILLGYGDYERYRWRLDRLVEQGVRFVRWGAVQAGQPGTTIGSDNVEGGRAITRHLLTLGRRRIAFAGTATSGFPEFRDRFRGHDEALAAAGVARSDALRVDALNAEESGHAAALSLMASGETFDAIVTASDLIALGAIRALREAGRSVPRDVAVTGFDDIPAAAFANPPLTTVAQDTRAAGELLVETLLRSIQQQPVASVMIPARLVVRGSCGAAVATEPRPALETG